MSYKIERNIVVPDKYVQNASGFVAHFRQVHLHSTANPSAPLNNEVAYLSRNYPNGNYTHLVGENGPLLFFFARMVQLIAQLNPMIQDLVKFLKKKSINLEDDK